MRRTGQKCQLYPPNLLIRLPVLKWISQHVRLRGTIRPEKHEPISSPQISVAAFASIFGFPRAFLYDKFDLVVLGMAFSVPTSGPKRSKSVIEVSQQPQSIEQQQTARDAN